MAAQLAKMADRVTAGTEIRTEVRVNGVYRPLRERVEDELMRIAQEAVTNAVRHAEAKRVEIQLKFSTAGVVLTVQDNGRGFSGETAVGARRTLRDCRNARARTRDWRHAHGEQRGRPRYAGRK